MYTYNLFLVSVILLSLRYCYSFLNFNNYNFESVLFVYVLFSF